MSSVSTKAVAQALGLSERTVRLYAQRGKIPFTVTPGGHRRFDVDEVAASLRQEARRAPTLAELRAHRREINACARRHGARDVRVFGSVAAGTPTSASDVDLLVALDAGRTYADIDDLSHELAALLGHPVDVLTEGACHGRFADVPDLAIAL